MPEKRQRLPKEIRLKQVEDCLSSGLSVKEWCKENGVSPKTFYYWKQCTQRSNNENAEWIDLAGNNKVCTALAIPDKAAPIIVHAGAFSVEVAGEVDETRLTSVLKVALALC